MARALAAEERATALEKAWRARAMAAEEQVFCFMEVLRATTIVVPDHAAFLPAVKQVETTLPSSPLSNRREHPRLMTSFLRASVAVFSAWSS